jgi:hypothetical protein
MRKYIKLKKNLKMTKKGLNQIPRKKKQMRATFQYTVSVSVHYRTVSSIPAMQAIEV